MRHVLLIDSSGNVALGDVDNGIRMPIGRPLVPADRSRVTCAVWSPAGRWTAWSVDSAQPEGIRELRLHDEDTDVWGVLAESVAAFYLCPSPCGRWLAHLSVGPLGLELGLSDVRTRELRIVERGQPMFWSWAPGGRDLAIHVGERVLVAAVDGGSTRLLTDEAGPFVVPWWLPGGSIAHGVEDRIVATGPDGAVHTLVSGGSSGRFAPDPDGRRLAHIETHDAGERLVVVDLVGGGADVVTTAPVGGFFWSPDGSRLAAVTATRGGVRWTVSDGSRRRELPAFRPTRAWATAVLPFFEQHAQSHQHWSPDGRYLIAPAVGEDGTSGALVQAVEPPHETTWMADADLVWWA